MRRTGCASIEWVAPGVVECSRRTADLGPIGLQVDDAAVDGVAVVGFRGAGLEDGVGADRDRARAPVDADVAFAGGGRRASGADGLLVEGDGGDLAR